MWASIYCIHVLYTWTDIHINYVFGLGFWGLGSRVWGKRSRTRGLGLGFLGLGFRLSVPGFDAQGLWHHTPEAQWKYHNESKDSEETANSKRSLRRL